MSKKSIYIKTGSIYFKKGEDESLLEYIESVTGKGKEYSTQSDAIKGLIKQKQNIEKELLRFKKTRDALRLKEKKVTFTIIGEVIDTEIIEIKDKNETQ